LFVKKFRDVIFRSGHDNEHPEYDRVELEVIEDSFLHLSFALPSKGDLSLDVVVADTMMMN
jgi:hypothetical protein